MDELKQQFSRTSQEIDQDVQRLKTHGFTDAEGALIDRLHARLQSLKVTHEARKQSYKPHLREF